jgi:hypothetical protein
MSKIALEGNASGTGTFTIAGPNTNTNYTITLPQETGTLITTGITTGLNGSAITTGTVAASVGGTGITSVGTAGNVLTSNGTAWVSQAAAAGGGDYIMQVFTTPGTWTKPAGLKAIKVTVIGGGGGSQATSGGAGGSSSFGSPAFLSATGGGGGNASVLGAGGAGSGGQLNSPGSPGVVPFISGCIPFGGSLGGNSAFGFGPYSQHAAGRSYGGGGGGVNNPTPASAYGGGGGGGAIEYIDAPALPGPQPYTVGSGGTGPSSPAPGFAGAAGVIIVEEFY